MIAAPRNDSACLSKIAQLAASYATHPDVRALALHLGSLDAIAAHFRAQPQTDDNGHSHGPTVVCDVIQRTRWLPPDPNCVERSLGWLGLAEALAPGGQYTLATIDAGGGELHTAPGVLVGDTWEPVDLSPQPQRNASGTEIGKDVLSGADRVGGGVLDLFGLHTVTQTARSAEDKGNLRPAWDQSLTGGSTQQQQAQAAQQQQSQQQQSSQLAEISAQLAALKTAPAATAGGTASSPLPIGSGAGDDDSTPLQSSLSGFSGDDSDAFA